MYLSKKKKLSFNIAASIFAGAAIVAFATWITQCKPQGLKFEIKRENQTPDGVLCRPGDKVKLCVVGSGEEPITWEYDNTIPGITFTEDTTDNSLTISVGSESVLMEKTEAIILAKSGEIVEDTIVIPVGTLDPIVVPTNDEGIFKLGTKINYQDTILGFSDQVISDPTKLWAYSSLDFSNQDSIEYIGGDCAFNCETGISGKKIFDIWKPLEMNFGDITFLPNEENGYSGYRIFKDANLNSLISLNFGFSNWAYRNTSSSAKETFDGANLSGLVSLNIKEAIFASDAMSDTKDISTADSTFCNSDLSNLTELDLSKAHFASIRMPSVNITSTAFFTFRKAKIDKLTKINMNGTIFATANMSNYGVILTADLTFAESNFFKLTELNLTDAVFAAEEMSIGANISSAEGTFSRSRFFNLTKVNLNDAVFAAKEMNYDGNVYTAEETFYSTTFDELKELNISKTVFAAGDMTVNGTVNTACATFAETTFNKLTNLDLSNTVFYKNNSLKNYHDIYTAFYTFDNGSFPILTKIDMSNCVFATEQMIDWSSTKYIADGTFRDLKFTDRTFESIILPTNYDASWGNWSYTFSTHNEDFYVDIYGYDSEPIWYTESWWLGANWVPPLKYIPITQEYFKLVDIDEDGVLDTVKGFSKNVEDNPNILNEFNAWDFSIRDGINEDIKNIAMDTRFKQACLEQWDLYLMSLRGLMFLNDIHGITASDLFSFYDLSSIRILDLSDTVWAQKNTYASGQSTFFGTNLSNTASLKLSGAKFAVEDMGTVDNPETSEEICSAWLTFSNISFSNLRNLNLSNTIFACDNMAKHDYICSAYQTFRRSAFNKLTYLDFSNAVFATAEIAVQSVVDSGYWTFEETEFSALKNIDMSNLVLSIPYDNGSFENMKETFRRLEVVDGIFESILLPSGYEAEIGILHNTFTSHVSGFYITVYGYEECPVWFDEYWWLNATWKLTRDS